MSSLVERATADPGSVTEEDIEELLVVAVEEVDADAIRALVAVADAQPDRVGTVVAGVERVLDGERTGIELEMALRVTADLGSQHPDRVAALAPTVLGFVDHDNPSVADTAVRALAQMVPAVDELRDAEATVADLLARDGVVRQAVGVELARVVVGQPSGDAATLLDPLLGVVEGEYRSEIAVVDPLDVVGMSGSDFEETARQEDQQRGVHERVRERAARTVGRIAETRPGAVAERADRLVAALREESVPPVQYALADALAPVAEHDPAAAMGALEPLVACLETPRGPADTARVARTVSFLADADERRVAEAVHPHLDTVLEALDADAPGVRGVVASLLMYVAERYPDDVADGRDRLLELLDDEDPSVRGSAAVALGAVGGERVRERLAAVAASDPDEQARAAAARAVDRLDAS